MKKVLRTTLVSLLVLILSVPVVFATEPEQSLSGIETLIDSIVQDQLEELNIPGAAVSVVYNGEILAKGYGYADLELGTASTADTLFRIGSVSKLVTWTAVMQLVEQGKLDLDADVNSYLDFSLPDRLKYHPDKATPGPITLYHLLTHTGGFEEVKDGVFFLDQARVPEMADFLRDKMPARIFPPGEAVAYSNYGAALAGYIVERVSGQPFMQYVDENIFAPLAMNHSTFAQTIPQNLLPHLAKASRYIDGEFHRDKFVYVPTPPAGSMSTSAYDMAKFMIAHLQQGQGILRPETAQVMHNQQFTHHPQLDGMAFGFVERTVNGQRALFHGGDIFSFQSGLFLLPEHDFGLYVSYSGGGYAESLNLFHHVMDHLFPGQNPSPPSQPAEAADRSKAFVGEYHPNRRNYSSAESLLILMDALHIDVNQQGYLTAAVMGETIQFAETEPGIYQRLHQSPCAFPYGALNTLVFDTDSFGQTMLFTDGKVSYIRAPWYTNSGPTIIILGVTFLFCLFTLLFRGVGFGLRKLRHRKLEQSKPELFARWAINIFAGSYVITILSTVVTMSQIEPLMGQPLAAFGIMPPWTPLLYVLSVFMIITGLAMIPLVVYAWCKSSWTRLTRVHFTVFTVLALALLSVFNYWNLFF